jgi:uncharacterized protein YjbJ (UPF0337 family)
MDWNQGNWKQVKGNVKRHWGKLTNSDLTAIGGRREELEGKIQERYGYTKDRVRKEIDDWYASLRSELHQNREEWADQLDTICGEIERLTSTFSRIANTQLERAQDKAVEAAQQAENAVRRNPTSALAIAFGVGFVFGALTRR